MKEIFHAGMSKEEILSWFGAKLGRKPTLVDVYNMAKEFYNVGSYEKAAAVLEVYATLPGNKLQGLHLLGYSLYMAGSLERSLEMFKACIHEGYDDDWQLLVEIEIEIEAEKIKNDDESKRHMLADGF